MNTWWVDVESEERALLAMFFFLFKWKFLWFWLVFGLWDGVKAFFIRSGRNRVLSVSAILTPKKRDPRVARV